MVRDFYFPQVKDMYVTKLEPEETLLCAQGNVNTISTERVNFSCSFQRIFFSECFLAFTYPLFSVTVHGRPYWS